jgi:dihydroorotase/N-acyl-D-amino-acid deacylase
MRFWVLAFALLIVTGGTVDRRPGGQPVARSAGTPPARATPSGPTDFDVLLTGGTVVDGSGAPGRLADVGIAGDRITAVGDLSGRGATRTVDARGLVVAPGFIDMLGWSQMTILVDNRGVSKVTQGITTEITGEGWSPAPVNANTLHEDSAQFARWGLTVDWADLDGYFRRLERSGTPFNLGTFVGATTLRLYVMGRAHRAPTTAELARMVALADTAMRQGALGLSTSLIYEPGSYALTDEIVALARVAARYGGLYASHVRGEGAGLRRALAEAFRIGQEAGVPVEVWHLKVSDRKQWGSMPRVLGLFDSLRSSGSRVGANSYPYTRSATGLTQALPSWARIGGDTAIVRRLRESGTRARIRREIAGNLGGVIVLGTIDTALRRYQGRQVTEIARAERKPAPDVVMDILAADHAGTGAAYASMDERDVRAAVAAPWVGVGSDFGATAPDGPLAQFVHPRAYGTFPRILGRYVREQHLLTLEAAVHKMTGVPAERFGLRGRGCVREGCFADLAVFDPRTVADQATFSEPNRPSVGIRYVLVGGRFTMDDGRLTAARPGRALRGSGWSGP